MDTRALANRWPLGLLLPLLGSSPLPAAPASPPPRPPSNLSTQRPLETSRTSPAFTPALPPHLLATEADFARMNRLAQTYSWARTIRDGLLADAESWPDSYLQRWQLETFVLPPEGGQWVLYYYCPTHGAPLTFVDATTHTCPYGEVFSGWPYDQVIYTRRIDEAATAAARLGLAYRLTGTLRHAEAAAEILNAFAAVYQDWPLHDENNRRLPDGARAHAQTLDEAVWMIPLAWAYDLIADSPALTDEDRRNLQEKLLRPAVKTVLRYPAYNNWQIWHDAGMAAVGFTLQDEGLIDHVLNSGLGLNNLLDKSVTEDGFWWEGAWSYHFYALEPLIYAAEMASRSGENLYSHPHLRPMFDAPLDMLAPDLTLPAFNDAHISYLAWYAHYYEPAYARFQDSRYASVLGLAPRSDWAFYFGAENVPAQPLPVLSSCLKEDSGYAVLRQPRDDGEAWLAVDFGPHGGGHGHFDKLGFISYGAGRGRGLDPGTQAYSVDTHQTWDKLTVAHNTLVLDGQRQVRAAGELDWYHATPQLAAVRVGAGRSYHQAEVWRTLALTSEYVLDRMEVSSQGTGLRTMDLMYHNPGTLLTDLPLIPAGSLGENFGYQHLTQNQSSQPSGSWQVTFAQDRGGLVYRMLEGAQPTTVFVGLGLGPDLTVPVPYVLARREARETETVSLLEAYADQPAVTGFVGLEGMGDKGGVPVRGVAVEGLTADRGTGEGWGESYQDLWALCGSGEGSWTAGPLSGDGALAFRRQVDGALRRVMLGEGRLLAEEGRLLLDTGEPVAGIEVLYAEEGGLEVWLEGPWEQPLQIYAPEASQAEVNGEPVAMDRQGDYALIAP